MRKNISSLLVVTLSVMLVLVCCNVVRAQEIRVVSYNIENWRKRFDARPLAAWAKTQPRSEELTELIKDRRNTNDKENWFAASVLLNPEVNGDVVVFQEGCNQDDLNYFNKRWLNNAYETAKVFASNTNRDQHIGILIKPGFKIIKVQNDYYKELDTVSKSWLTKPGEPAPAENRLFARGPAFVLIEAPSGYQFWVGTNHNKSKADNSVDVSKWRLRESTRIHQIIKELEKTGPSDVIFGGDLNDELGFQEFEQEAGGDAIAAMLGKPEDGLTLITKDIADKGAISFGGYFRDRRRSFIDHFLVTTSMKPHIAGVSVYTKDFAPAASDHYPVVIRINPTAK